MKLIKYIFLIIGILMLVGAYFLYKNTADFINNATTTEGTVVELIEVRSEDTDTSNSRNKKRYSYTYKPRVEFNTKTGKLIEFMSSTSSNPPSYTKGEKVEVLYLEDKPEKAKINGTTSLWLGVMIIGGLGSVFFLIGFGIFFLKRLKERKIQSLKDTGTRIITDIQSVSINTSYKVNGRSPFVIYSQWKNPATSEIHIFESDNIWFDPTDYIKTREITVLIARNNPKKYYTDLSFLPKLT